jgi:hypothetical protein
MLNVLLQIANKMGFQKKKYGSPIPRQTGRLTVSRKLTSASASSQFRVSSDDELEASQPLNGEDVLTEAEPP